MDEETIIEESAEETEAVESPAEEEQAEELIEESPEEAPEEPAPVIDQAALMVAAMEARIGELEAKVEKLSSTVAAFVEAGAVISDSSEPVPAIEEADEGFVPLEGLDFTLR